MAEPTCGRLFRRWLLYWEGLPFAVRQQQCSEIMAAQWFAMKGGRGGGISAIGCHGSLQGPGPLNDRDDVYVQR